MAISPARIAAYEVLLRIERDHAYSSVLLPQFEEQLSEKDRGLCHEIVLGVLRRKYGLDAAITRFAGSKKIDLEVLTSLRIGTYQLLFLDRIPDHSSVNESVSLVQRAKKSSAKGFVNAILRKVAGADDLPDAASTSGETSHPQWLLDRWAKQFGKERANSIARANNETPPLTFRLTANGAARSIQTPASAVPSAITDGAFVAEKMTSELRVAADRGEIYFQDEASQMVARSVSLPSGGRFLDVCAAPGGKTTLIAARSEAAIVAGDIHHARVEFVRSNAARQGVGWVNVVQYDAATALPFPEESFDSILLDAPCSGTGTIRSNPEIRYFLEPGDIEELSLKQLAMLINASKVLKTSGRLYYSTCSLEHEENEGVIAEFLRSDTSMKLVRSDPEGRFSTQDGFLRTFPDRDGSDGFFLAVLGRE
jgi:16S rRNA (cytosine967-C5)-methyltransferase